MEQIQNAREKMTIFYKLRNYEIDSICTGIQDLELYSDFELEDAKLIYGYVIVDLDMYVLKNRRFFELIMENDELKLQMKEEYKDTLKKYM